MNGIDWQLDGAYPAKNNENPKYKGRCSFSYVPPKLSPLRFKRSYKRDDGTYGESVTAEIEPGPRVRITDAHVSISEKGEPYVRCSCGLDLPWEFSTAVGAAALAEIEKRNAAKAGAA